MKKEIIFSITLIFLISLIQATYCPFNEISCEYPGKCGRYIDENSNKVCDLSEKYPNETKESLTQNRLLPKEKYPLIPLLIITLAIYLFSQLLSKKKIISIQQHKKFWNTALLVSFLGTGITGIILTININFQKDINLPINTLFWHVETGIIMTIISIFHIIWHWKYFKKIIPYQLNKLK